MRAGPASWPSHADLALARLLVKERAGDRGWKRRDGESLEKWTCQALQQPCHRFSAQASVHQALYNLARLCDLTWSQAHPTRRHPLPGGRGLRLQLWAPAVIVF